MFGKHTRSWLVIIWTVSHIATHSFCFNLHSISTYVHTICKLVKYTVYVLKAHSKQCANLTSHFLTGRSETVSADIPLFKRSSVGHSFSELAIRTICRTFIPQCGLFTPCSRCTTDYSVNNNYSSRS